MSTAVVSPISVTSVFIGTYNTYIDFIKCINCPSKRLILTLDLAVIADGSAGKRRTRVAMESCRNANKRLDLGIITLQFRSMGRHKEIT